MKRLLSLLVMVIGSICAVSGHAADVAEAARHYRETSDYASLKVVADSLVEGMPRQKVEALLGPADFSPVARQSYYYSDRKEVFEGGSPPYAWLGLVVTFREDGRLEWWELGPIGE